MATAKSKLPSPGIGGGSVTRTLMDFGSSVKRTASKIYGAFTGGPRQQSYGWVSEFFPEKVKSQKNKERVQKVAPANNVANIGPVDSAAASNEQILQLLKDNYQDEKRNREVQKSFMEERASEEQRRHNELVKALKSYGGQKTATAIVEAKKEEPTLLEHLLEMFKTFQEKVKSMIDSAIKMALDGIELIKKADLLGKLMLFLRSPIFGLLTGPLLMVAGILGLAYALRKAVELVPDYSKLTPEEARNVLENGSDKDIDALGGRQKLMQIVSGARDDAKEQLKRTDLTPEERAKYSELAGIEIPTQSTAQPIQQVPPRPDTTGGKNRQRAANWDAKFGANFNPDGSPKNGPVLGNFNPEPGADASMGPVISPSELESRNMEEKGGGAAFGVRAHGIKVAPVPPPPTPVAQLTDMNNDLVNYSSPMGDIGGVVVQQNSTGSTQTEPPIPTSATQRDEEPMAAFVFRTQRWKARAH